MGKKCLKYAYEIIASDTRRSRSLSYYLINKDFFSKTYQCLIKNIFINHLDKHKRPEIAGLIPLQNMKYTILN